MQVMPPLEPGRFYHIYNRGNNRENIFLEDRNYYYFLQLWSKYIEPVAATYAYCLMKNHFHFLVRVRDIGELQDSQVLNSREISDMPGIISRQFSNLFNAYTKSVNKAYSRTGSLFQERFRRREVTDESYLTTLIAYIHSNPQRHGFTNDYREWPYSSFSSMLSERPTKLQREQMLDWFGGADAYQQFHQDFRISLGDLTELDD